MVRKLFNKVDKNMIILDITWMWIIYTVEKKMYLWILAIWFLRFCRINKLLNASIQLLFLRQCYKQDNFLFNLIAFWSLHSLLQIFEHNKKNFDYFFVKSILILRDLWYFVYVWIVYFAFQCMVVVIMQFNLIYGYALISGIVYCYFVVHFCFVQ